jgi:Omp85 superfamily domain
MTKAAIALLGLALAGPLRAQDTTITIHPVQGGVAPPWSMHQLPADVAEAAVRLYNADSTVRLAGDARIPATAAVEGDVAVLGGTVVVAGRIGGSLVVVNGDLTFEPGATVGGDVLVVGGTVSGAAGATIRGAVQAYRDPLSYRRRESGELVYAPTRGLAPRWIEQLGWGEPDHGNRAGMLLALAGTYNRVEGLPVLFGPRVDLRVNDAARFQADALAIFRTSDIGFNTNDIGYRAHGELNVGGPARGLAVGLRGYDVVAPVESWPLKEFEVGWASFLFHRDYRDYYRRHGGSLYGTWRISQAMSATAEYRDESEASLLARTPWTVFRTDEVWRVNPPITDGRYHAAVASFRYDTRNDRGAPSSGWLLAGEYEVGRGTGIAEDSVLVCGSVAGPCAASAPAGGALDYQRAFLDARRYLRLSPSGRLNLRLAGGGWTGGGPLPLQRRVALGFPDPLPGYGFRQFACDPDALPGQPALCDRVLVAQAEFRTHLGLDFGPKWASDWGTGDEEYEPFHVSGPDLVVFADAGRAWAVARPGVSGPDVLPPDGVPALSTYKTELGVGLDFGPLGFYLAKPLNQADRDVTFTLRMGRRF